jgi:Predicted hydrolase of the HD superfamily (permuted catalytic motifs)
MKYTAITIGPIIASLDLARKTREIWAASYFFSSFMQIIIEQLEETANSNDYKIVIPSSNKDSLVKDLKLDVKQSNKTGLYPDRLIIKSANGLYEELQTAVEKAIEKLSYNFKIDENYLKQYLTYPCVELELDDEANAVFECNKAMATTELQASYIPKDELKFLEMLEKIFISDKYKTLFGKQGFPSIIEISTRGLDINQSSFTNNDNEPDDNENWNAIVKSLNQIDKKPKQLHKYIAIIQADGDNVGKLIKAIYEQNPSAIENFSNALSMFSLKASNIIKDWGGEPIYAGGDDLLFFAPLENKKESIVELINSIDTLFAEQIVFNPELKDFTNKLVQKPSMSYGLSISYFKYPMHEALKSAQSLLFAKAKKGKKNALAFSLLKHSGQTYSATLCKSDSIYSYLIKLIYLSKGLELHSMLYNLNRDRYILKEVIITKHQLKNYFNNYYNEDVHRSSEVNDFIELLIEMLHETYKQNQYNFDKTINDVMSVMQFVKFLNTSNHE